MKIFVSFVIVPLGLMVESVIVFFKVLYMRYEAPKKCSKSTYFLD